RGEKDQGGPQTLPAAVRDVAPHRRHDVDVGNQALGETVPDLLELLADETEDLVQRHGTPRRAAGRTAAQSRIVSQSGSPVFTGRRPTTGPHPPRRSGAVVRELYVEVQIR